MLGWSLYNTVIKQFKQALAHHWEGSEDTVRFCPIYIWKLPKAKLLTAVACMRRGRVV
jgi:hypothetical protein